MTNEAAALDPTQFYGHSCGKLRRASVLRPFPMSGPHSAGCESGTLVAEPVAVADQSADRPVDLVRQRDDPVLVGRPGEKRALDRDGVEREIVERRHPARVGRPRPHAEVTEEGERPGPGSPTPHDDRLVAGRVAAGRDDGDARQELALAVGPALGAPVMDELELGLDVARD